MVEASHMVMALLRSLLIHLEDNAGMLCTLINDAEQNMGITCAPYQNDMKETQRAM